MMGQIVATNGKILNKKYLMFKNIILIKFIIIFFFTTNLHAFEKAAEQLVQSTTNNAKSIILSKKIENKEKKEQIEKIALEVVDVDGLSRFTLGSFRKDLNEDQLKKYNQLFRIFFAKNISSRLQNYSDQNIKVIGSKKISDNYVLVNSKMTSKIDNQEIKIDWRVFKINDKLLIRDLVVEGLSLAKTQREEFNSIFSSKGYDGLVNSLSDFISKN